MLSDVARLVVYLLSDDASLQTAICIDLLEQFFGMWEQKSLIFNGY